MLFLPPAQAISFHRNVYLAPFPFLNWQKKRTAGSGLARTVSERLAQRSDNLLSAIEHDSIAKVREELDGETKEPDLSLDVLTAPNLVEKHKFRTPLMAAVVRKDLPIFMALLHRFEKQFSIKTVSGEGYCPEDLQIALMARAPNYIRSLVSSLAVTTLTNSTPHGTYLLWLVVILYFFSTSGSLGRVSVASRTRWEFGLLSRRVRGSINYGRNANGFPDEPKGCDFVVQEPPCGFNAIQTIPETKAHQISQGSLRYAGRKTTLTL